MTNSVRLEHREALSELIASTLGRHRSEAVVERLEHAGIANAQLRDMDQFIGHPQLTARERWREVGSPVGPIRALLPPAVPEGIAPVMAPVPAVGEHTQRILSELGLSAVL